MPVHGWFTKYAGDMYVDSAGRASGGLVIDAATIATGIKKRDARLRASDFFDVERHRQIRFELNSLRTIGWSDGRLRGALQIRDHSIPIDAPVSIIVLDTDLHLAGDFVVNHHAAGFEFERLPKRVLVCLDLALQRA